MIPLKILKNSKDLPQLDWATIAYLIGLQKYPPEKITQKVVNN